MKYGYQFWALGSAAFAGATALLAKKGVSEVPSNLATAIRVVFILVITLAIAWATKETNLKSVPKVAWVFLALSAVTTGLSWLCYFRALQMGPVSKVAPIDKLSFVLAMTFGFIFLREKPTPQLVIGAVIIVVGVLVTLR